MVSFAGRTENWMASEAVTPHRPVLLGNLVRGTGRYPPRNLHYKDTDCFKRLAPNKDSLFWWSTGWPVNNNNIYTCVHLCKLALAYTARGNSLLAEAGWVEGRQNLPQSSPFYCVGKSKFDFSIIVQTRAKPGAVLQTSLCFIQSFIHSLSHTVMVCKNICMTPPPPNGWRWCFQS